MKFSGSHFPSKKLPKLGVNRSCEVRNADWSSIAFGESWKRREPQTLWSPAFGYRFFFPSKFWTGKTGEKTNVFLFLVRCGWIFLHGQKLFYSYFWGFTGSFFFEYWKIPKGLSSIFFPLLAGATWRMSSHHSPIHLTSHGTCLLT